MLRVTILPTYGVASAFAPILCAHSHIVGCLCFKIFRERKVYLPNSY